MQINVMLKQLLGGCLSEETAQPRQLVRKAFNRGLSRVSEAESMVISGSMASGKEAWHWSSRWEFTSYLYFVGKDRDRDR